MKPYEPHEYEPSEHVNGVCAKCGCSERASHHTTEDQS